VTKDTQTMLGRSRWRALLQDTGDNLFDRYLGIETARPVHHGDLEFGDDAGGFYQASNWVNLVLLAQALRRIHVKPTDSFIDFGCGKGQVLALAARFPFGKVIGLDLSPSLIATAQHNMDRIRAKSRSKAIELVQQNALDYEIPDDLTIAYFYMPFPTSVYEPVVRNIAASIARHPRTFRIIYLEQGPDDPAVPGRHGFERVVQRRRMAIYMNVSRTGSTSDTGTPEPSPEG
jgi:SAM-dependent methyltransferase